jgi:agmatine deiminase
MANLTSKKDSMLPSALGFRMPAEWEPHAATWLAWPHNEETWPGKFDKIPQVWVNFVKALKDHEKVKILVKDATMEADARTKLEAADALNANVEIYQIPTNDSWIRDFGPIFIKNPGHVAITDWIFKVWGGRWEKERPLDNAVPSKIAARFGYERFEPGIVLEGGSIDVNGKGTLLTTESCLLSPTRNPHLSREQIEGYLNDYLAMTNVIWLKEGIAGDDTSGHIDDIARFTDVNTVVCILEENPDNENHEVTQKNFETLQKAKDQDGTPLKVLKLPMPALIPGPQEEGYVDSWIPASYANFYIANNVVLLPVFDQPSDEEATRVLQGCFPNRKIVPINGVDLVWGLGGIHCVTQQEPAA